MPVFELTLLGTFGLTALGTPRSLRSHKAQALLTYLALRPLQAHRRDTLASLLWSHVPTSQARHSLRQTISFIRSALEDVPTPLIVTEADTLRLNTPEVSVDAIRFAELASSGPGPDLRAATTAYIGELLEGVHLDEPAFDRWLAAERERLHHRAVGVFSRELQRSIDEGPIDEAIATALRLLSLDPLLEWVHRALMKLYHQQGRFGAALTQYNHCARIIEQELGVEPELETRQLLDELRRSRRQTPPADIEGSLPESAGDNGDTAILPYAPQPRIAAAPRATVIVLQATAVTRAMLERLLVPASYALVGAKTLAEALMLLNRHTNPVILIADEGPRHRTEAITAIRGTRDDVPVVVVTNEPPALPQAPAQPLRYVRRPIGADALLGAIAELLGRRAHPAAND